MKKAAALFALLLALCCFGCDGRKIKREESVCPPPSYHIVAELLPETNSLTVKTQIDWTSPADDLAAVKFKLYPNAYKTRVVTEDKVSAAYPHGKESYGGTELVSVTCDVPLADSDVGEDGLALTARLSRRLKKGERVTFTIDQTVTLACVKHRLGYYDGYYYLSNFYPEVCPFADGKFICYPYAPYGDPFRFENAAFSLELTLPVNYECACSAEEVRAETCGKVKIVFYQAASTREVALVASQKLRHAAEAEGDVKLFYYYADGSDKQKTLALIKDAISYFSERFGNYPYPTYTVVSAPFFEAGVEHSGLAVLSKDLPFSQKKKTLLHETAHQWWFGKVGNDEVLSPWLDEGLAEYSVASYYRDKGFTAVYREMIQNAEDAFSIRLALKGQEGARFDLPLPELADGYYDRAYAGGLLLFSALSESVGVDRFHAALKTFANRFQGAVATPDDLVLSLSASLQKDYSSLFRAWLTATVPLQ